MNQIFPLYATAEQWRTVLLGLAFSGVSDIHSASFNKEFNDAHDMFKVQLEKLGQECCLDCGSRERGHPIETLNLKGIFCKEGCRCDTCERAKNITEKEIQEKAEA